MLIPARPSVPWPSGPSWDRKSRSGDWDRAQKPSLVLGTTLCSLLSPWGHWESQIRDSPNPALAWTNTDLILDQILHPNSNTNELQAENHLK